MLFLKKVLDRCIILWVTVFRFYFSFREEFEVYRVKNFLELRIRGVILYINYDFVYRN